MTPLIERNTTIPTGKQNTFSTAADNQPSVEIHILQGERTMAGQNTTLGKFMLTGIPPAPRGVPQVEVKFDIDRNGILNVSAKDLGTGNEQKIEIKAKSNLTDEEIEARVQEAETHAEEDRQLRELVEIRNQGESLIYATEKSLKELGEKVDEETRKAIEEAKEPLKEAMKGDDLDALKVATEAYMTASQVVGQQMYQQAAEEAAQQAPTDEEDAPAAENVVDVDYEEIDEK